MGGTRNMAVAFSALCSKILGVCACLFFKGSAEKVQRQDPFSAWASPRSVHEFRGSIKPRSSPSGLLQGIIPSILDSPFLCRTWFAYISPTGSH